MDQSSLPAATLGPAAGHLSPLAARARRLGWRGLVLAAVSVATAAAALFWYLRPLELEATAARLGPATALVYATGFVEAEHPVSVAARTTAPVLRVLAKEGDRVRSGQPLVLLEAGQQRALVAQAAAERRRAELDEERVLTLFRQGWVTRTVRDQAVATAAVARAAEASARAQADQLVVRAGIDGVVLKRDVEPGDLAVPTRTLFLLGDPDRIKVTATVDERDVARVRVGQEALMTSDAWATRVFRGRVREVTPGGDPTQRTFRVRLAMADGEPTLPIGLTLEVNIVTGHVDRAILVPASAIAGDGVWVVADGRLVRRTVRTGIVGPDEAQLVSGAAAGEQVVVDPPDGLEDGDRVRARPVSRPGLNVQGARAQPVPAARSGTPA